MTEDVTCKITVGGKKVAMEVGGEAYEAPIMRTPLTDSIVRRLDRFVSHHPSGPLGCERDDLALLGTVLFQILFGGKAEQRIIVANVSKKFSALGKELGQLLIDQLQAFGLRQQEPSSAKFRISLTFDDDASSLGNYPWEFLYVERPNERGFFLGERATLIRVVSPVLNVGPSNSLNVLVAWAQPQELDPLLGASEMAASIEQRLDGRVDTRVESLANVTWPGLTDYLENNRPDILHIIAHGRLREQGGELAFLRTPEEMAVERAKRAVAGLSRSEDVGQANWIAVSNLAAQLQAKPPHLVFLHACNSSRANSGVEAFRGAAEKIARAGVPFVVAMQYEIANEDADAFAREFYATIASPEASVDDAVRAGRIRLGKEIPAWSHRRFATPVVYLHNEISHLIAPREQPVATASGSAEIEQTCPFDQCTRRIKAEGKFCVCERRNRFAFCCDGHANRPGDEECWRKGCEARVVQPRTAAAPPVRAPTQAGDA